VSPGGELPLSNLGQLELLRAMMERGVPFRTRARGFSMAPAIRDEDVVTVVSMKGREPYVGEVVAFMTPRGGRLALHRVVAWDEAGWLLRGDNCRASDGVVAVRDILGRVVRVERNGRDVRLGTALGAAGFAWLSRRGVLVALSNLRRLPRRIASSVLQGAQGLDLYRVAGRRIASPIAIVDAAEIEVETVRSLVCLSGTQLQSPPVADSCTAHYVARRRRRVVGLVRLVHIQDTGSPWAGFWLCSLKVRGRYRGVGVGEALARRVIQEARAQGAGQLSLEVFKDNKPCVCIFRKLGFVSAVVDALEPQFEEEERLLGRRRIVMRKVL
jgi:ribosomal protein S18 acetylase RimI-like enzyme